MEAEGGGESCILLDIIQVSKQLATRRLRLHWESTFAEIDLASIDTHNMLNIYVTIVLMG